MKKQWLRLAIALLLAVCVLVALVACGDKDGGKGSGGSGGSIVVSYYITSDGSPISVRVIDPSTFRISVPTRTGYTFLGLYDAVDGGTQIVNEQGYMIITPASDITLYAQWEADTYTFVLNPGEGELIAPAGQLTYAYGDRIGAFPIAVREGYDFAGWCVGTSLYTDAYGAPLSDVQYLNGSYPIGGDGKIRLEARWERKRITVTFDYNDGSYRTETKQVDYGDSLPASEFPFYDTGSREVRGWSYASNSSSLVTADLTSLKQDITLYAVWNNYKTVRFVEHGSTEKTVKVYQNAPYTPYEPERFGYEFDGWYTSTSFAGLPVESIQYHNARDVYYANWTMAEYTVTFVVDSDVTGNVSSFTYTIEDYVPLPEVSRVNYTFLGWRTSPDPSASYVTALPIGSYGDKVLYPCFRGIDVTALLDPNGGTIGSSGTVYTKTLEYGTKGQLPVAVRDGFAFVGYFLEDGTQITDRDGNLLSPYTYNTEQTLIATYDQKRYITVDIPHAAGSMRGMRDYYVAGETVELLYLPEKAGYTFVGYYLGDELVCDQMTYQLTVPEGDLSLSVRVRANTYTVTLNLDGGFGTDRTEITVTYGEEYTLPILYKNGMVFGGWRYGNSYVADENGRSDTPWQIAKDVTLTPYFTADTSGVTTYYIDEAKDLALWMSDPSARYVLIADIDMTGIAYAPTGVFSGTFDGVGHTVRGLTTSLFHEVTGTVRNLTVEANIVAFPSLGLEYYGIVANHLKDKGEITLVTVSGSVNALTHGTQIDLGGIVGVARGEAVIRDCVNRATVVGNAVYGEGSTGGIVGSAIETATVVDCVNHGAVTAPFVGGIAGHYASSKTVEGLSNDGAITATSDHAGGLIGYVAANVTLLESSNTGKVDGKSYVGGLIGYAKGNALVTDCHSDADVTGAGSYVGGLIGNVGGAVDVTGCSTEGILGANAEAGGFFGYIGSGSIADSTSAMAVTATNHYVGGFVGRSSGALTISTCRTSASVLGAASVGKYVGAAGSCTISGVSVDIADAEQLLAAMRYGTAKGEIYNLVADIDMSGVTWTPIAFSAVLNGNGYTIKNLTVESEGTDVGMFTTVSGTVENLSFENVSIRATSLSHVHLGVLAGVLTDGGVKDVKVLSGTLTLDGIGPGDVGGIVGALTANVTVSGCENHATVHGNHSGTVGSTGGIVGWMTAGTVTGCKNYGEIQGSYLTGGVVGGVSSAGTVTNSENHGAVTGTLRTGGILGSIGHSGIPAGVRNTGSVTGTDYVGGLFGYLNIGAFSKNITALSNEGDVSGENYVGGIFGYFRSYSSFGYNSNQQTIVMNGLSNSGTISGNDYVGGLIGYTQVYSDCSGSHTAWIALQLSSLSGEGDVTGRRYVGGLFGYVYSDNSASVLQSSSACCTVTVNGSYGGAMAGHLDNLVLKDCKNEGSTVVATEYTIDGATYYAYIGGYVGRGGSIYSCNNASDIVYNQKGIYVGGIAGYISGNLQGCQNSGMIYAPQASYVGGLVGRANYGATGVTFTNLSNTGEVTGLDNTGGILGYVYSTASIGYNDSTPTVTFNGMKNTGKVTGASFAGGICGYAYLRIDCDGSHTAWSRLLAVQLQNEANISGTRYVGGLFGYAYSDNTDSSISGSSSRGEITAECLVGGLAGKLENVCLKSSTNAGTTLTVTGYFIDGANYYAYVGGYVGYGYLIDDCVNATPITYNEKGYYVGGIVGYTYSHVTGCENSGTVYAPKATYVGGIAGRANYGSQNVSFTELINTADVTGADYTGGILGCVYSSAGIGYNDATRTFTVKSLENSGNIVGGKYTAGLIGYFYADLTCDGSHTAWSRLVATKLLNTGDVTGVAYVGGLFGYAHSDNGDSTLTDCTSSCAITAEYYVGGLAGRLENIQLLSCSNAGTTITATGYEIDKTNYNAYVGGYVGYGYLIDGCDNATPIHYTEKGRFVGGIAGYINHNLKNSTNTADVYAPNASYVGGMVGYASYGRWSPTYTKLTNTGNVTGAHRTGGIVGEIYTSFGIGYSDATLTFTMTDLQNSGSVTGTGEKIGGMVGNFYANITHDGSHTSWMRLLATKLLNTGDITGAYHVGGLFGYAYTDTGDSSISDSASSADVRGEYYVGGLAGQLVNVRLLNSSNEGSTVTATGYLVEGTSYSAYVGGYVGYGYAVSGCHNTVAITYTQNGRFVGGIVGYLNGGSIDNCSNSAPIHASRASYVGGLVGRAAYGNQHPALSELSNSASVTGADYVGGLFGHVTGSGHTGYSSATYTFTLSGAKNTGEVIGAARVGGICGYFYLNYTQDGSHSANGRMIAVKAVNSGSVTASSVGGGLFGEFYSDGASTAQECATLGTVTVADAVVEQAVGASTNLTFTE